MRFFLLLALALPLSAFQWDFRGELAAYGQSGSETRVGMHYLPLLEAEYPLTEGISIQAEWSAHLSWGQPIEDFTFERDDVRTKNYRLNARLQTRQLEVVAGLQKLNFGPGRILRPLMWFDRLDPTDPLGIATGVTGLSVSYYFQNLVQVRLWALESGETKGWEQFPGLENHLEGGGRLALPLFGGELGSSAHLRQLDNPGLFLDASEPLKEIRLALDGFWDVGVGLWFEGTRKEQRTPSENFTEQVMAMLGGDYTFPLGNGVHFSTEHLILDFVMHVPPDINMVDPSDTYHITAFMLDYPVGFFDQVSLISLYEWEQDQMTTMISWNRAYDHWQFNLTAFDYPDNPAGLTLGQTTGLGGDGIQLLIVFNH